MKPHVPRKVYASDFGAGEYGISTHGKNVDILFVRPVLTAVQVHPLSPGTVHTAKRGGKNKSAAHGRPVTDPGMYPL